MKKLLLVLLATVLIFGAAFVKNADADSIMLHSSAAEEDIWASGMCGDNVRWEIDNSHVLTFSGSGDMYDYEQFASPWHGLGVVGVVFGSDVTSLSSYAFSGCGMLEWVEFAENGNLRKIGDNAFSGVCLENFEIPASVEEIGESAFSNCHQMTEITFAENSKIRIIGDSAFNYNTAFESINIPASVTYIGDSAFKNCQSLETVVFEENGSLKKLGNSAFEECRLLESINLPLALEYLGESAFDSCVVLKEISLGSNIEKIEASTFYYCFELQNVNVPEDSKITRIDDNAFYGCGELTDFSMPAGVTFIGKGAFEGCILLNFDLPEGLEYAGDGAFERTGLTEINIPETVTYFGSMFCPNVKKYTVEPDNQYYSSDEAGALFNKDKTVFIAYPSSAEAKEYGIPEGVKTIAEGAFFLNLNLEKVTIPAGVKEIGESAFAIALSLKELVIPEGVETIGDTAFHASIKLEKLVLPSSLKEIGSSSFLETGGLKEVIIYSKELEISDDYLGLIVVAYVDEDGTAISFGEVLCDYYYYVYTGHDENIVEKYGSLEKFSEILNNSESENYVVSETCTVYCYKDAAIENYLKENNVKYKYLCEHIEEVMPAVDPTCTQTGLTEGIKCSVCGDVLTAQETVEELGHSMGEFVETSAPDCTRKGEKRSDCSECDYFETEEIPANGHTEEIIPAVAPTCTSTGLTEGVKCSLCGDTLVEQTVIGKGEHKIVIENASEPDVGVPGYTGDKVCDICGELIEAGEEIPAIEEDTEPECDHMCHKEGFFSFIWKIINFFGKLFNTNPVCECGAAHY